MIKKSVLFSILLLLAHALYVNYAPPLQPARRPHPWHENIISAQRYIYDKQKMTRGVIVGSSLARRIEIERFPGFYNLSFSGQGILDGLNILRRVEDVPDIILIEMNLVLKDSDEDFASILTNPFLARFRKAFPSLRSENQPSDILIALIRCVALGGDAYSDILAYGRNGNHRDTMSEDLFDKMLAFQISEYSQEPARNLIDKSFRNLRDYVKTFEKMGKRIIFFEMPINEALHDLPKARIIREAFQSNFPPDSYDYVYVPHDTNYRTTDGLHLGEEEALMFSNYLKSQIDKLVSLYL